MEYKPQCKRSSAEHVLERFRLGYGLCLPCGEIIAKELKFTVLPMHKSNYIACFNMADLKGINNKGGLVK